MFAHQRKRVQLLFAVVDAVITAISFEAAYESRRLLELSKEFFLVPRDRVLLMAICIFVWVVLGISARVYEHLDAKQVKRIFRDTIRQCLLGLVGVILLEYLVRLDLSRGFLFLFVATNCVLLIVARLNARRTVGAFQREFGQPYRVLVVGGPGEAEHFGRYLKEASAFRLDIAGVINDREVAEKLPQMLSSHIIDEVIFRVDSNRLAALEEMFLLCDEEGVKTRIAVDFFPHVNSELSLDFVGTAPLLTFSAAPLDELRLVVKRSVDITVSLAALVLLSVPMLLLAGLIKLTSTGPALFTQVRCGLNGRRFTFYKFRSMVEGAEGQQDQWAHLNQKQTAFKIPDDPRLTTVGRWIRKFSLDELPQFFNILKGDMSLVGPRPPVPQEVALYERWQRRRLRMRPGLTCLWAVRGRDRLDFDSWMKMDMEYIDNWSLTLDCKILLKSIPYVLTGSGAY